MSVQGNSKILEDFDKLWNYSEPAQTEAKFKDLIPSVQSSGNKDYYLQLITQIARAQGLQRKFDEAHKTLDEVEKKIKQDTPIAETRFLLERGRVFNSSQKKDKALPLFYNAFELATKRHQDNLAVDAAHMIAISEKDPKTQNEWNLKAIVIAEKSNDPKAKGWLASLYNNMAWTYHDSGQFEEALRVFQMALIEFEKKGEISTIRIAKYSVARAYRSLKKYSEALNIQIELEKELNAASEKDGYVYEEQGELYLALSNLEKSKYYFSLAYQELSKDEWLKANEPKRIERIKELGVIN